MIEIVPPLYWALASLFLGLTLAAMPARDKRLTPNERMGIFGVFGGLAAAAACICIALVPLVGRALLAFSTLFLWMSFMATGLRVHSWCHPLSKRFLCLSLLALGLAIVLMLAQFFTVQNRDARVIYQLSVSLLLLGWMIHGLRQARRHSPSLQLDLMVVGTFALMLLISVWSWTLLSDNAGKLLLFSEIFSEESLAFSMRLFVVAALALLLISANGYGLERLVSLNSTVTDQMAQSDQLNQQLNTLLNEKNEMLQVLSFAARSQNLPAIMSSLAHEINQPLGAIRLNADFLLAEDASLSAAQREQLLHQLVNCSNAATQVVRDFRRFLETHLTPHVKVDVSQLLSDLVRGFQEEFHRQCVQVEMHADEDVAVQGDPVQLESALTGLLLYMIKRKSPDVRHMEISAKCIGRFLHLRLVDNGPPISASQLLQALVDRPMHEANHAFNQSLWLSRAIIENHGGAMSVHESPGQTGIHLQLPILDLTS